MRVVVNSGSREINEKWKAVDFKIAREISPSGRMAGVGTHVAHGYL